MGAFVYPHVPQGCGLASYFFTMFHKIVDRMYIVALIFEPYYRVKFQG